ncbi:MAG: hypothetical protein AAGL66_20165, partial [Pseudomonadota bacterium]
MSDDPAQTQGAAITRRQALRVFSLTGSLVVAAPALVGRAMAEFADAIDTPTAAQLFDGKLGPFVQIVANNTIVIGAPIPDMGTGVETALPMIVAEELDVDWQQVQIARMPFALRADEEGELVELFATQGTGGSGSVRRSWNVMRRGGALARELILRAAAQHLAVDKQELITR